MIENKATKQELIMAPSTGAQWEYVRRQQSFEILNLFFLKDPYTSSYSSSSIEYSINIQSATDKIGRQL